MNGAYSGMFRDMTPGQSRYSEWGLSYRGQNAFAGTASEAVLSVRGPSSPLFGPVIVQQAEKRC